MAVTSMSLTAQTGETYSINFRVYGLRPGVYADMAFRDMSNSLKQINFASKSRSASYQAKLSLNDPVLHFYNRGSSSDPLHRHIASVQLSPADDNSLLVFSTVSNRGSEKEHTVHLIGDGTADFPAGSIKFLNLTGVPLNGSINKTRFDLKPSASSRAIRSDAVRKNDITIIAEGSSRYHLVYKNILSLQSDNRALIILRAPPRIGSHRIGGHILKDTL